MTGALPRSGGSLHLQPGSAGMRAGGAAVDSPSSLSLNGLTGLDAMQGSLTSNALFGSLNLEELMNTQQMQQEGRDLVASMRAAEAMQRAGGPGAGAALNSAGVALPSGGTSMPPPPPFAGFHNPELQQQPAGPQGRSADEIWRGLGADLGGWAPSGSASAVTAGGHGGQVSPQHRSSSLAPDLGGYLPPGGAGGGSNSLKTGSAPVLHGNVINSGLGSAQASLASSMTSTGLAGPLGALMFSSGSTDAASHLAAAGGGSGWYSQLGLNPPQHGSGASAAARSAAGLPHVNTFSSGAQPLGGHFMPGQQLQSGSHPGTPDLRTASAGTGSSLGSPRFSSHAPLPAAGALFGDPPAGPGASPPRFGSRDASLSPPLEGFPGSKGGSLGGGPAGLMPPPHLIINGRPLRGSQSASPQDVAAQGFGAAPQPAPQGRRPRGSSRSGAGSGSTGRSSRVTGFPEIPNVSVPRVRAQAAPDTDPDFDSALPSSRERHKATRGRVMSVDEKEARELKRKEANRESAARSRDKRLKLIADLEVEVQQLKKQHADFKAKVIESTVPRPKAEAVENWRSALRKVRTDPADCEAQIRQALVKEGLDPKALAAITAPAPSAVPT